MFAEAEQKQIDFHLHVPACEILSGAKRHLRIISMDDLILLCRHLRCNVAEVTELYWSAVKKRARKGKRSA